MSHDKNVRRLDILTVPGGLSVTACKAIRCLSAISSTDLVKEGTGESIPL